MALDRRSWLFALGLLAVGVSQLVSARRSSRFAAPPGAAALRLQPQQGGLPAGAVARLGQTRCIHADKPTCVAFAPGRQIVHHRCREDGSVRV